MGSPPRDGRGDDCGVSWLVALRAKPSINHFRHVCRVKLSPNQPSPTLSLLVDVFVQQ